MAKNKTTETQASVTEYLANINDEKRRKDCSAIAQLIAQQTGFEAKMWGPAIVGFGSYHYKYDSGHEGNAPLVGFASRTNAIALYLANFEGRDDLLAIFGKHKTSKGCVYIKKLDDIDTEVLAEMAKKTIEHTKKQYPG